MVNSLRSSLSKNGLIFIREISSSIPKAVEGEMFTIIPGIMRRSIDTNVFISDEAEQTLCSIAQHCSEGKVISALLQYSNANNKASISKAKISLAFNVIIERLGKSILRLKDLSTFLSTLVSFSGNSSPDVRRESCKALKAIADLFQNKGELDNVLRRNLNEQDIKKFRSILDRAEEVTPSPTKLFMRRNVIKRNLNQAK